jgi:hypothetical protein
MQIETANGPVNFGSLYAPAERRARLRFWSWLKIFTHEGHWLLAGDFNMVELPEDSAGPSKILHGAEARLWSQLIDNLDLIDHFLCSVIQHGPANTRQAISGNRFDSARLDRIYSSHSGSWFHYI